MKKVDPTDGSRMATRAVEWSCGTGRGRKLGRRKGKLGRGNGQVEGKKRENKIKREVGQAKNRERYRKVLPFETKANKSNLNSNSKNSNSNSNSNSN